MIHLDIYFENIKKEAHYLLQHRTTIRTAAKELGISKSSLHTHMQKVLSQIDPDLSKEVAHLFEQNWNERHSRGGKAMHLVKKQNNSISK